MEKEPTPEQIRFLLEEREESLEEETPRIGEELAEKIREMIETSGKELKPEWTIEEKGIKGKGFTLKIKFEKELEQKGTLSREEEEDLKIEICNLGKEFAEEIREMIETKGKIRGEELKPKWTIKEKDYVLEIELREGEEKE
ncbi:MAG: hypothetical protein COX43_00340 [Parcubacteria group bacterium CG23_combo_of_CG06-09_8_20_14_all_35_9]|nr:MAG: hypothetical protein COX43_00340 [Parcubacteria group bacterium CG23_combo_of_CG06-09_8_20_14_all_35_9]